MLNIFGGGWSRLSEPATAPATSGNEYGIKTITEPTDATLDVVFVHGLTGGLKKTWTHEDGTFWPQDLLPNDFPKARILTFGYDANITHVFGQVSTNTLRDHGRKLCTNLTMLRLRTTSNNRPIVFISHSLGGLVCQQALLISSGSPENYYRNIIETTTGVIFIGTPHAGADIAAWVSILTSLAKIAKHTNSDIVEVLKPGSQVLAGLQQEFHRLLEQRKQDDKPQLKIFCIYEELPVSGIGMIVERHSAILTQYDCIGLHGNHMEISKFGKGEAGYDLIRDRLWVWINVEMNQDSTRNKQQATDTRGISSQWQFPPHQLRQSNTSKSNPTKQRIDQMASLTWQLYSDCDEILELKPLCPGLGTLNLQFRKAEEYISQDVLDKLMQDMLLNVVDGCYAILTDLKMQIQENQNLENTFRQNWKDIVWCEDQIQWRIGTIGIYIKGLSAMNTNFQSESRAVVVQKFISVMEDMKSGKIEGSVLSQSLDYVTAEDGESDLVWKLLRADLEVAGVSTSLIDKHRVLITAMFKELLDSGELTGVHDERNENSLNEQGIKLIEEAKTSESETESDLSDREVFFGLASRGHAKRMHAMIQAGINIDLPDEHGNTALHLAASAGHIAVVTLLLAEGAIASTPDAKGSTAMRLALENGHHAVLRAIVKHSPNSQTLDAKVDRMGDVTLHYAVNYGDEDSVLLLLRSGANPNVQNRFGQTPLHLAAWGRNLIVLRYLLDSEVELDIEDFWGDTALEVAVSSPINTTDKAAVVRMCLEARLARNQGSTSLDVNLDDAVKFLTMESIYDNNSEDNIFKVSLEGRNIAELLPKQSEMNNLAEELFDIIYGR